ncbi:MAG: hypothetical protein WCK59_04210 [Candidatus Falkowbacteria bacterium]
MKALLETCTPGQVKRIMSIMADSIPTKLPKEVATMLIEVQLKKMLGKLWEEAEKELWKSLMKTFDVVFVAEMELNGNFSFNDYVAEDQGKLIGIQWSSSRVSGYPKAEIFGKKQAVMAKVTKTSSVEEFCLHVALNRGYLPGREGLIQFYNTYSEKISELVPSFGWLVAPVQSHKVPSSLNDDNFGIIPTMHKEISDGQGFIMTSTIQLLQRGQFVLFFTDAVKK